jgi:hypothetical protein
MRRYYQKIVIQYLFLNFINLRQLSAQSNRSTHRNRTDAHCFRNLNTFIPQFTCRNSYDKEPDALL